MVTEDRAGAAETIAGQHGTSVAEVLASPQILIGSVEQMVELLQERRERYGFSYIAVTELNMDKMAPVVERLAGT